MNVRLIKRRKILHCGIQVNGYIVSLCSGMWMFDDSVDVGEDKEVTCKRCLKIMATASEDGTVVLKPKRKRA